MSEGNGLEMTTTNGKKDGDLHRKLSREEKLREAKIEDQVCVCVRVYEEKHVKIFGKILFLVEILIILFFLH